MSSIRSKIRNYLGLNQTNEAFVHLKNRSTKEASFVVLDIETTGLDMDKDKILSFGAVKVENGRIQINDSLEKFFRESKSVLNDSVKIHGIVNSSIENGHDTKEALGVILDFIGQSIVVGHHIDFDYTMLKNAFSTELKSNLENPKLDTALLAIRLEKGAMAGTISKGEYTLDSLCKRHHIETYDRHTAPGDAFLTAQLLIKLLKQAEEKGINTIGKLLEKRRGGLM